MSAPADLTAVSAAQALPSARGLAPSPDEGDSRGSYSSALHSSTTAALAVHPSNEFVPPTHTVPSSWSSRVGTVGSISLREFEEKPQVVLQLPTSGDGSALISRTLIEPDMRTTLLSHCGPRGSSDESHITVPPRPHHQTVAHLPTVIIFHCEFSQNRGPEMLRAVRSYDRRLHPYPFLAYPELYIVHKGYREFVKMVPALCVPHAGAYVEMSDLRHRRLLDQHSKERKWAMKLFKSLRPAPVLHRQHGDGRLVSAGGFASPPPAVNADDHSRPVLTLPSHSYPSSDSLASASASPALQSSLAPIAPPRRRAMRSGVPLIASMATGASSLSPDAS
jgi:hypothetical protein